MAEWRLDWPERGNEGVVRAVGATQRRRLASVEQTLQTDTRAAFNTSMADRLTDWLRNLVRGREEEIGRACAEVGSVGVLPIRLEERLEETALLSWSASAAETRRLHRSIVISIIHRHDSASLHAI